jgi:hypothetical protein
MVVFINEWLPNPTGPDVAREFIELYNDGAQPVGLGGWAIKTENGKKFSLSGRGIVARGYLVLKRSETKLSLRNESGGISLYDAKGVLVDQARFLGSAPEGKSFSRVDYGAEKIEHFTFVDPTPGVANKTVNTAIAVQEYPRGVPLNRRLESSEFLAIMVGTAAVLAGLIIYVLKANEDLSELFFGRDAKTR